MKKVKGYEYFPDDHKESKQLLMKGCCLSVVITLMSGVIALGEVSSSLMRSTTH